jgi:hypothetical protein
MCSRQTIHETVALIQGEGISSEEDLGEGFEAGQDGPGAPVELTSRAYEELASKKRGARKKPLSNVADFAKVRTLTTRETYREQGSHGSGNLSPLFKEETPAVGGMDITIRSNRSTMCWFSKSAQ